MPNHYSGAAAGAASVTPSDTVSLGRTTRALWVGSSGDISAVFEDGSAATLTNVPVGVLPVADVRVNSTSTTASEIVALW